MKTSTRTIPHSSSETTKPRVGRALRWGLIADDLTGACDAGVQFAQRGLSSVVRFDSQTREDEPADLTVLTTNSRSDLPALARRKVEQACRTLIQEQGELIYKKIDSTLQGNIGPEIEAAMEQCGRPLALVAPAFPAMGRSLMGGRLRVGGSLTTPSVDLPSLLRDQGVKSVVHVEQSLLSWGPRALNERLETLATRGPTMVVIDAVSQDDLALVARIARELQPRPLMAGSAGLAAEVAAMLAEKRARQPVSATEAAAPGTNSGSVIFFVGSTSPVTRAQVDYLAAKRRAVITSLGKNQMGLARQALRAERPLVVTIDLAEGSEQRLAMFLPILEEFSVRGMALSGGDTAQVVCRALKATGIRLEREIVPGVPWGRLAGGRADRMAVATKAGSFGEEDTLAVVADFLGARSRSWS